MHITFKNIQHILSLLTTTTWINKHNPKQKLQLLEQELSNTLDLKKQKSLTAAIQNIKQNANLEKPYIITLEHAEISKQEAQLLLANLHLLYDTDPHYKKESQETIIKLLKHNFQQLNSNEVYLGTSKIHVVAVNLIQETSTDHLILYEKILPYTKLIAALYSYDQGIDHVDLAMKLSTYFINLDDALHYLKMVDYTTQGTVLLSFKYQISNELPSEYIKFFQTLNSYYADRGKEVIRLFSNAQVLKNNPEFQHVLESHEGKKLLSHKLTMYEVQNLMKQVRSLIVANKYSYDIETYTENIKSYIQKLAEIAFDNDIKRNDFLYAIDFIKNNGIKQDGMPDINFEFLVNKKHYFFKKLPPNDMRGFILGKYSNSCQSIGNTGQAVAFSGMKNKNAGFYIIEDNTGKIRAQGYAWLAHHNQEVSLVLDSFEYLGTEDRNLFVPMINKLWAELATHTISNLYVGTGGQTPKLALPKLSRPTPMDSDIALYGDASTVYHINGALDVINTNIVDQKSDMHVFENYHELEHSNSIVTLYNILSKAPQDQEFIIQHLKEYNYSVSSQGLALSNIKMMELYNYSNKMGQDFIKYSYQIHSLLIEEPRLSIQSIEDLYKKQPSIARCLMRYGKNIFVFSGSKIGIDGLIKIEQYGEAIMLYFDKHYTDVLRVLDAFALTLDQLLKFYTTTPESVKILIEKGYYIAEANKLGISNHKIFTLLQEQPQLIQKILYNIDAIKAIIKTSPLNVKDILFCTVGQLDQLLHNSIAPRDLKILLKNQRKISDLSSLLEHMQKIGLKPNKLDQSCKPARFKRATDLCLKEESFQYDQMEDSNLPSDHIEAHRDATMISLAVIWSSHTHHKYKQLKTAIKYYRNIGKIINEGEENWSNREQNILLKQHAQYSRQIAGNIKALLQEIPNNLDSWHNHKVKIYDNGKHSLFIFRAKDHVKIYSTDLDYKTLYKTGTSISHDQLQAFIDAFFMWKDGSSNYTVYTVSNKISPEVKQEVLKRMLHPKAVESDHQILHKKGGNIESISLDTIRDIFALNGKPIDIKKLSKDFFAINHKGLILRVDKLHTILPHLTKSEQKTLCKAVKKYNIDGSWHQEEVSDVDTSKAMKLYSKEVIKVIKEQGTIDLSKLSELSWASLSSVIKDHPMIDDALGDKIAANSKTLHNSIGTKGIIKEAGKQGLFFLPSIIKAINTHQYQGLVETGGMIAGDMAINQLVTSLAKYLPVERAALLSKLPITSPIFKAVTIYSIVELHQELNNLPSDAPQKNMIKHELAGQYATIGLICAEMLGIETGPLWFVLIGAQLAIAAEDMREMNKLDISFIEALEMSLGFKQDELNIIMEEREIVDIDLLSPQASKAGYAITQVPKVAKVGWQDINRDEVPETIRSDLEKQIEAAKVRLWNQSPEVTIGAYKLINSYEYLWGKLRLSYSPTVKWQMRKTDFVAKNSKIKFGHYTNNDGKIHHIESNNWFLDEVKSNNYTWTRVPQNLQAHSIYDEVPLVSPGNDQVMLNFRTVYKRSDPTANITDPVSRTETGNAALYINQQVIKNNPAKLKHVHFAFDPRRGNITLDITEQGLKNMDATSQAYLRAVGNNAYNTSSKAYVLQTTISQILLPELVTFRDKHYHGKGTITVDSDNIRVISVYNIAHNTPCIIRDTTNMMMIRYIPDPVFLKQENHYYIKGHIKDDMINICIQISNMDDRHDVLIQFNSNKKYFNIDLNSLRIKEELELGAETLELLNVQGDTAAASKLYITPNTQSFNMTLLGNIIVQDDKTTIEVRGVSSTNNAIIFTKVKSISNMPHYSIGNIFIKTLLQNMPQVIAYSKLYYKVPSADTNSMIELGAHHMHFSFVSNNTYGTFNTPQNSIVSFSGALDNNNAEFNYFDGIYLLKILDNHKHVIRLEYTHYKPDNISVSRDAYITGIFDYSKKLNKPTFAYNNISSLKKITPDTYGIHAVLNESRIYAFSTNSGLKIIHSFPKGYNNITVNEIIFTIKNNNLCAIDGVNHNIDGNNLLSIGSTRNNQKVGICFSQDLTDSVVSCNTDAKNIVINDITLHNIEPNTQISFNKITVPVLAVVRGITSCDKYGKIRGKRNVQEVAENEQVEESTSSAYSVMQNSIINNSIKAVTTLFDNTWASIKSYVSTQNTEYFDVNANIFNMHDTTQIDNTAISVYNTKKTVSIEAEHCVAGARSGYEYVEGTTCYIGSNKYSKVTTFPIKSLDTCSAPISQQDEIYSKASCIPMKFNSQEAVYCEGQKTSIIYTPYVQPNILEHINNNLMLAQVFVHLGKTMWQWYKSPLQETSSNNLVTITQTKQNAWYDSIAQIQDAVHVISESNDIVPLQGDPEFIKCIQDSKIEDLQEEISSLIKAQHVSYVLIEAVDTTLSEIQNELYEIQTRYYVDDNNDFDDAYHEYENHDAESSDVPVSKHNTEIANNANIQVNILSHEQNMCYPAPLTDACDTTLLGHL